MSGYNKLPELKEREIQQQIIHYLQAKGWYVQRMNAGQYSMGEGRYKRYVMGAAAGTPDIFAFKRCTCCVEGYGSHVLFVEVKRPGKQPTPLQELKMAELRGYGARCVVATSIEDLIALGI
jgi:hypothetical protein